MSDILITIRLSHLYNQYQNYERHYQQSQYISVFFPDVIISIGTAGGVEKNGAKERDIYSSEKIYFYDRRIASKDYHEYELGGYTSAPINKKLGFKSGRAVGILGWEILSATSS